MDKGPWSIFTGSSGKLLGVISEDFEHDVHLEVKGDFRDDMEKLAYCEWLRNKLNEKGKEGGR